MKPYNINVLLTPAALLEWAGEVTKGDQEVIDKIISKPPILWKEITICNTQV